MRILHGDAVVDMTGRPFMEGLPHFPGYYVMPGLLPGSIKINTNGKGAGKPRELLVRAGWSVADASKAVLNVLISLSDRQLFGQPAAAQTGFRAALQRTIIIHISAWNVFLISKTRATWRYFTSNTFTTVDEFAAIPPCPPLLPKPTKALAAGGKQDRHVAHGSGPLDAPQVRTLFLRR